MTWRKSSYSNANGCVEWRKSSHSFSNGNCVECVFRAASHSTYSGNCAEVAGCGGGVRVRDSKNPDGPQLAFDGAAWREFTGRVKAGALG